MAGVPKEQLAVVPGAQAGLFTALKLLLGLEGGEVLMPAPCYSTYEATVVATGGTPVLLQPASGEGFALRPATLAAAVTPRTRVLLVTTPNNPTGEVLSRETLSELGELCRARGLWCVCDETYTHLVFDGGAHVSAASVPSLAPRAVVIGSLSKALLRPGWRLGWLVAPPALMPSLEALAEAQHFGLSPFLQTAAAQLLADPAAAAALAAEEAARYQRRRDALLEGLAAGGAGRLAAPLAPAAGMFVMVDVSAAADSSLAFAQRLMLRHSVATLPGEGFGGGAALGHLRVALLADEARMRQAGAAIAACALEMAAERAAEAAAAPPAAAEPSGPAAGPAPEAPADALSGATALFAVRLDAGSEQWTRDMLAGLRAAAGPGARVLEWREGSPLGAAELAASAAFVWDPPPELLARLPALRLVVSLGAGVDHCAAAVAAARAARAAPLPLARTVDPLAAQRLGNYALWGALHASRRMEEYGARQAARSWDASPQARAADPADFPVGVLGLGAMGAAAVAALARNGFPVLGWRRGGRGPPPPGLAALHEGAAGLPGLLRAVRLLVVVLPLTPATRGLLGEAALRQLPRGAQLLNAGRAEVVDEAALLALLQEGHLGGATLDVAAQEPLGAQSPLWAHPRVRLTPHVAGHSSGAEGAAQAVANWRAALEGRQLLTEVSAE